MKKEGVFAFIFSLALLFFIAGTTLGGGLSKSDPKYKTIEKNYLEGLKSDNTGLRISCVYFLGELKSSKAVIPLMRMLNEETHEGARIAAAWSLAKIGDARGIYLLKQVSETCDCCSVQCMTELFYRHFVITQNGGMEFDKLAGSSDTK